MLSKGGVRKGIRITSFSERKNQFTSHFNQKILSARAERAPNYGFLKSPPEIAKNQNSLLASKTHSLRIPNSLVASITKSLENRLLKFSCQIPFRTAPAYSGRYRGAEGVTMMDFAPTSNPLNEKRFPSRAHSGISLLSQ